ncbi:hypothetical protein BDV59DRAFT_166720 [Aspergillus ambiguus]|uniref:uncharacterized protein n=1 Tax=Aspergillus ambiguus TaxID=176160 RepID=UPI003CCC99C8
MVPLAAHTVRLNGRTTKARKTINESEPVPSEEAESVMDQHQKTVDSIKHTLNAALSKEAVEDPNGFRRLLALGVGYWGNEYDQLWNTLKTKIPEDMHARVASPSAELSDHFRTVQQRLS